MAKPTKVRISVCMIVRDEERVLGRCLNSLRGAYDELCIVDTGSTDGTLAMAREYGARVRSCTRCNGPDGKIRDFSLARNASLAMANGDYILWIDADEVLSAGSAARIRQHARQGKVAGVRVSMRWGNVRWFSCKLIKNARSHRFVGRVHECVTVKGTVIRDPEIVIRNRPNKVGKEGSAERNIRIGRSILEKNPKDKRALFYLGNALKSAGLLQEAIDHYRRYLDLGGNFRSERHAAAHRIAVCHILRQEWQSAIDAGFQALQIDPRYAETHCILGDAYGATGEIVSARQWYRSALSVKAPPPDGNLFTNLAFYGRYPRRRLRQCDDFLAEASAGSS